jgi:hypothetical protein
LVETGLLSSVKLKKRVQSWLCCIDWWQLQETWCSDSFIQQVVQPRPDALFQNGVRK